MLFLPGWAEVTGGYSWCAPCLWHLLCSQWGGIRHHQSSQSAIRYTVGLLIPVMVLAPSVRFCATDLVLDQSWIQILLLTLWVKGSLVVLPCWLNVPFPNQCILNLWFQKLQILKLVQKLSLVLVYFTCSPTHSEWPATGWCTRTLILFCGGGHCHKRYCSMWYILQTWNSTQYIEGSQTYTPHTYLQGKKLFATALWSRLMIVEMHWPRPYMAACLDGSWMESTIICSQRMWTTRRKWGPTTYSAVPTWEHLQPFIVFSEFPCWYTHQEINMHS